MIIYIYILLSEISPWSTFFWFVLVEIDFYLQFPLL